MHCSVSLLRCAVLLSLAIREKFSLFAYYTRSHWRSRSSPVNSAPGTFYPSIGDPNLPQQPLDMMNNGSFQKVILPMKKGKVGSCVVICLLPCRFRFSQAWMSSKEIYLRSLWCAFLIIVILLAIETGVESLSYVTRSVYPQKPDMQMSKLFFEASRIAYFDRLWNSEVSQFVKEVYNPIGEVRKKYDSTLPHTKWVTCNVHENDLVYYHYVALADWRILDGIFVGFSRFYS